MTDSRPELVLWADLPVSDDEAVLAPWAEFDRRPEDDTAEYRPLADDAD